MLAIFRLAHLPWLLAESPEQLIEVGTKDHTRTRMFLQDLEHSCASTPVGSARSKNLRNEQVLQHCQALLFAENNAEELPPAPMRSWQTWHLAFTHKAVLYQLELKSIHIANKAIC